MLRFVVSLPIDPLLPEIIRGAARAPALVLEAPPGAGKRPVCRRRCWTSSRQDTGARTPPACRPPGGPARGLRAGERRWAKASATRFASSRCPGPGPGLLYMTEGVLIRRLHLRPTLDGISVVVLDEFHERHLDGDLALGPVAPSARHRTARSAPGGDVGHARRQPVGRLAGRAGAASRREAVPARDRLHASLRAARSKSGWPARSKRCWPKASKATCWFSCPAPPRSGGPCAPSGRWRGGATCWRCRSTATFRPSSRTAP